MSTTYQDPRREGVAVTDRELATLGERLYEAVLLTPLPAGTIMGLATAIRCNIAWADLPRSLRFAVFKIAAACFEEPTADDREGLQDGARTPDASSASPPQEDPPKADAAPAEPEAPAAPGSVAADAAPDAAGIAHGS